MQLTQAYLGFVVGMMMIAFTSGRSITNAKDSTPKWHFWPTDFDNTFSQQPVGGTHVQQTKDTVKPMVASVPKHNQAVHQRKTATGQQQANTFTATNRLIDNTVKRISNNEVIVQRKYRKVVTGARGVRVDMKSTSSQRTMQETTPAQTSLRRAKSANNGSKGNSNQQTQSRGLDDKTLQFIAHLIEKYGIPVYDIVGNKKATNVHSNSHNDSKKHAKNFQQGSTNIKAILSQPMQNTLLKKPASMTSSKVSAMSVSKQILKSRNLKNVRKPKPSIRPDSLASVVKQKAQANKIQLPTFSNQAWNIGSTVNEIKYVEPSRYTSYVLSQPNPSPLQQYPANSNVLTNFRPYTPVKSAGIPRSLRPNPAPSMLVDVEPIEIP